MNTQYNVQMMCNRINCAPETCIILLISVAPINSMKRGKKEFSFTTKANDCPLGPTKEKILAFLSERVWNEVTVTLTNQYY